MRTPARAFALSSATIFIGTDAFDQFTAPTDENWFISGLGATDLLYGAGGNDTILGGAGRDGLYGSGGNDFLDGGTGSDLIFSVAGDLIFGGAGDDTISVGERSGFDYFGGGDGYDRIIVATDNVAIGIRSIVDIELIDATGRSGARIIGSNLDDALIFSQTELRNILRIDGGLGDDLIVGSAGNDRIIGGAGGDALAGGAGDDRFVYRRAEHSSPDAPDILRDFDAGDVIDLAAIDADAAASGNQKFVFIGDSDFTATGQLRIGVDALGRMTVYANTGGDMAPEMAIVLAVHPALTAADFLL